MELEQQEKKNTGRDFSNDLIQDRKKEISDISRECLLSSQQIQSVNSQLN
jgi:hypothetical protein